jgi:hypothetical protein
MRAKLGIACAALIVLSGCATSEVFVAHSIPLNASVLPLPEARLLDVGVAIFDPGVPEGEIDKELLEELIRDGTFVSIRRTESMYMAVQLRNTLQRSAHWGGVWVTPNPSVAADVNLTGEILHSDGDIVELRVRAEDATGRVWLDKPYELETAAGAYNRQRYPELDPYQDLFNSIANDLAAAQATLSSEDARQVRTVAQLRYAGELSPEAFGDYVGTDRDGEFEPLRLPATDDPMYNRTQRIRQRERVFLDTLNEHYSSFSNEASPSYDGWREYAREESIAIRELTRSSRWRTGMGIATILASVVYGSNSNNNSFSDRVVRDAMMYVGMDMIRTSAVRRQEKRLHTETLEELSESFEDEVAPLVVEVQGTQHRLTGTAEAQYAEWRDLLQRLFISETGFAPESIEVFVEPVPQDLDDQEAGQSETSDEAPEIKEVASDASGSAASGV